MDNTHKLIGPDEQIIALGAEVADFRGQRWTLTDWSAPRHAGSTGRVYLKDGNEQREFFPSVINAKIVAAE